MTVADKVKIEQGGPAGTFACFRKNGMEIGGLVESAAADGGINVLVQADELPDEMTGRYHVPPEDIISIDYAV